MQLNSKDGMQTLDADLVNLLRAGTITKEEALMKSSSPERLNRLLQFPHGAATA